jgi:hypothetical protein
MAKLVAHLLDMAALWIRIQTFLNTKMIGIGKGVANNSSPSKNIQKNI